MKTFQSQSIAFYLSIFTFILLSSNSLSARQNFEKGDKVEVNLKVNNQNVWILGTYEQFYKKKHRVTYSYNIDGWKGGGERMPFKDKDIRPFEGNITKSFEAEKPIEPTPMFEKGSAVEIRMIVNGQEVWIEGSYDLFYKGEHRVTYEYDIDGWTGFGKMQPISAENIRPFEGNVTTSFYEGMLKKTFEEGEKVEVEVLVNGRLIWVTGIYNQAYEGKHRVFYTYNVDGRKGRVANMPFGDEQIRPYTEEENSSSSLK